MSRIEQPQGASLPAFLNRENLLAKYWDIVDLFYLRGVNHHWKMQIEQQLLEQYLQYFSTFPRFKNLISILFSLQIGKSYNTAIPLQKKIFQLILHDSVMQSQLIGKLKLAESKFNNWQIMACIAPLNFKNFKNLHESKDFAIPSLNWQQKQAMLKFLRAIVVNEVTSNELHVNSIVLVCIKENLNHLLEFLLRIGMGDWYSDPYFLTEKDAKRQHPLICCVDHNNLSAFQIFLNYAQHLLKIYHKYSSSYCLSPPLNYSALQGKASFIKMVAEQKPEILDQLNIPSGGNIAHTVLTLSPSYDDPTLRRIIYTLADCRPGLFYVRDNAAKTPLDRLPKEFFSDPQFQLRLS